MALAISENRTHYKLWQVVLSVALIVCLVFTFGFSASAAAIAIAVTAGVACLVLAGIIVANGLTAANSSTVADDVGSVYNSLTPNSQSMLQQVAQKVQAGVLSSAAMPAVWYRAITNDVNNVFNTLFTYNAATGKYVMKSSFEHKVLVGSSALPASFSAWSSSGLVQLSKMKLDNYTVYDFTNFDFSYKISAGYADTKVNFHFTDDTFFSLSLPNVGDNISMPYIYQPSADVNSLCFSRTIGSTNNINVVAAQNINSYVFVYNGTSYSCSLTNGVFQIPGMSISDSSRSWSSVYEYMYHTFVARDNILAYSLGMLPKSTTFNAQPLVIDGVEQAVIGAAGGAFTNTVPQDYTGSVVLTVAPTYEDIMARSVAQTIAIPAENTSAVTASNGGTSSGTSPIFIPPVGLGESAASALGQLTSGYNDFNSQFQDGISGFVSPIITNTPAPIKTILISAVTVFMIAGLMVLVI